MELLFTRSNLPLSRMIRYLTGEDVSHCAVAYGDIVYHSNMLGGVHMESLAHFSQSNEIVYTLTVEDDPVRLEAALFQYEFSGYDYGGLLYLGLRCICPWLPKANLWQSSGMMLCTEWVEAVTGINPDPSLTPYQLYKLLAK